MMGWERSGPEASESASSEVDGRLDRFGVSLALWDARREGGGGGALGAVGSDDELDGDWESVRDCDEGLLRDRGGLLGPWLRRRLSGGVGGRLNCIGGSEPTMELELLRLELSKAGGGGNGLFRSDTGDLGSGETGIAASDELDFFSIGTTTVC